MKRLFVGWSLLAVLVLPLCAYGGVPLSTVEERVNHVLAVLRAPDLKTDSAKAVKKKKIRSISDNMFDYVELAKRTLGRNWKKLNVDQRKEFTYLYREILEKAYFEKILAYRDQKVVFNKETMLSKDKAEVQSSVITASKEIPIHYRLRVKNGDWRVYDIIIEGVSLVRNYRNQFKKILANNSPEKLLEVLRKKAGAA